MNTPSRCAPRGSRSLLAPSLALFLALASGGAPAPAGDAPPGPRPRLPRRTALAFSGTGHTLYGDWQADAVLSTSEFRPGMEVGADVVLRFPAELLTRIAAAGFPVEKVCALVTAERSFDADGWIRLPSDERMSTLLTPAGLAIEGGIQGAVTDRFGYPFRTPVDELAVIPAGSLQHRHDAVVGEFHVDARLPDDLPPGLYRLRFDFGVQAARRFANLNGFAFATRGFAEQAGTSSLLYSPVIPASGVAPSGRAVDGTAITARIPWLLLALSNSNGYNGVVADEDRHRFAMSQRNIIPDAVVLPLFGAGGSRLAYSLEPVFPTDLIDTNVNIPWNWSSGALTVSVTAPDGTVTDLGSAPFVAAGKGGPTTGRSELTSWRPSMYGLHTVTAWGWIADTHGRRYEGGGTYRFWIANRMTLATATFQGMPYPVGSKYGRDLQLNPPVPADVVQTATLYVNSDINDARTVSCAGQATRAGVFGVAQGMKQLTLDAPGEYHASILATYTDAGGHLWVCPMRHAGVVYPPDSPIEAHGKKLRVGNAFVDRGETHFEGYVDADGEPHLDHITFPYRQGDAILIASEGQGANKIEPVLTVATRGQELPWDPKLSNVGVSNLMIKTSNGYSPHLFPEYITDLEYYYGAAPRPGFMGRFLVGESLVRAPYWPVSPNAFGGQIGASPNGDLPGDVYRLLGGVVQRRTGQTPAYAGYIASAFLLPKGSNNNRVIAPGSEDLVSPAGGMARFFLVGLRPGMAYETGASFRAVAQIDPILPVAVHFALTYPDGREKTADGVGDAYGSFAATEAWTLDVPGVYRYRIEAAWEGHAGGVPGLPDGGGEFYVYDRERPAGAAGLLLDLPVQSAFSPTAGLLIRGRSSAASVRYAMLTPGAVISQGEIAVDGGRFEFQFDPAAVHRQIPIYDIESITTGKPMLGRVVHVTFASIEQGPEGASFVDFARVILRGNIAISTR